MFGLSGGSDLGNWGIPPSPHPLNAALGAGFAKSIRKILMAKSLEVKIFKTQDLRQILLRPDMLRPP